MDKKPRQYRETLRCYNCGTPLAQTTHEGPCQIIRVLANNAGKRQHVLIKCSHAAGGKVSIECEACEGQVSAHQHITLIAGEEGKRLNPRSPMIIIKRDKNNGELTKK